MEDDKDFFDEVDNIINQTQENSNLEKEPIRNNKNKVPKFLIIILILILIICIIGFIYEKLNSNEYYESNYEDEEYTDYLDNYSDEYDSFYDYKNSKAYEEYTLLKENIHINASIGLNERINCEIKNDNDKTIENLELYVIYYDGDNKPVKIESRNINILNANRSYYCSLDLPKKFETYERYEFLLTPNFFGGNKIMNPELIEISTSKNRNNLNIEVKNNSNNKIDNLEYAVIFYDDTGKIIDIEENILIDIEKSKKEEAYVPYYIKEKYGENLDYKVYVNYAYSYNY